MRRWLIFASLLVFITGALAWTEKKHVGAPPSPAPVLYFVADTERELTVLPTTFTAMSDRDEIKVGDELALRYLDRTGHLGETRSASAAVAERYVQEIGSRVAAHARRKLPYRFHYLDQPSFLNAY